MGFIDLWTSSLGTALTVLMAIVFVCRHDLLFSLLSVLWQGILWCTKFSIDEIADFLVSAYCIFIVIRILGGLNLLRLLLFSPFLILFGTFAINLFSFLVWTLFFAFLLSVNFALLIVAFCLVGRFVILCAADICLVLLVSFVNFFVSYMFFNLSKQVAPLSVLVAYRAVMYRLAGLFNFNHYFLKYFYGTVNCSNKGFNRLLPVQSFYFLLNFWLCALLVLAKEHFSALYIKERPFGKYCAVQDIVRIVFKRKQFVVIAFCFRKSAVNMLIAGTGKSELVICHSGKNYSRDSDSMAIFRCTMAILLFFCLHARFSLLASVLTDCYQELIKGALIKELFILCGRDFIEMFRKDPAKFQAPPPPCCDMLF